MRMARDNSGMSRIATARVVRYEANVAVYRTEEHAAAKITAPAGSHGSMAGGPEVHDCTSFCSTVARVFLASSAFIGHTPQKSSLTRPPELPITPYRQT